MILLQKITKVLITLFCLCFCSACLEINFTREPPKDRIDESVAVFTLDKDYKGFVLGETTRFEIMKKLNCSVHMMEAPDPNGYDTTYIVWDGYSGCSFLGVTWDKAQFFMKNNKLAFIKFSMKNKKFNYSFPIFKNKLCREYKKFIKTNAPNYAEFYDPVTGNNLFISAPKEGLTELMYSNKLLFSREKHSQNISFEGGIKRAFFDLTLGKSSQKEIVQKLISFGYDPQVLPRENVPGLKTVACYNVEFANIVWNRIIFETFNSKLFRVFFYKSINSQNNRIPQVLFDNLKKKYSSYSCGYFQDTHEFNDSITGIYSCELNDKSILFLAYFDIVINESFEKAEKKFKDEQNVDL